MKELILWREVDVKDELPDIKGMPELINCLFEDGSIKGQWYHPEIHPFHPEITHWLKRVVIPIDTDKEIELAINYSMQSNPLSMKDPLLEYVRGVMKCGFLTGYKAMQERLIGGRFNA